MKARSLIEVEFPTEAGKRYQLQFSPTAEAQGDWTNVGQPIVGTGRQHNVGARQFNQSGFFRVYAVDDTAESPDSPLDALLGAPPTVAEELEDEARTLPSILEIISDLASDGDRACAEEDSDASRSIERYVKIFNGEPIGPLMKEGDGTLDAARALSSRPGAAFDVKKVRVIIEE